LAKPENINVRRQIMQYLKVTHNFGLMKLGQPKDIEKMRLERSSLNFSQLSK
jgi:hypothetical protein